MSRSKFKKEIISGILYYRADPRRFGGPRRRFRTAKECEVFVKYWQDLHDKGITSDATKITVLDWFYTGEWVKEDEPGPNNVKAFKLNENGKRILSFNKVGKDQGVYFKDKYDLYLSDDYSANTIATKQLHVRVLFDFIPHSTRVIEVNGAVLGKKIYSKRMKEASVCGTQNITKAKAWGNYLNDIKDIKSVFAAFCEKYPGTTNPLASYKLMPKPVGIQEAREEKAKSYEIESLDRFFAEMFSGYGDGIKAWSEIKEKFIESLKLQIAVFIATGLRRGELTALTWDDMQEKDGEYELIISKIFNRGTNQLQMYTKTKLKRNVPIPKKIVERLFEYKNMLNQNDLKRNLIFPNSKGEFDKRGRLYKSMNNANKRLFGSREVGGHKWLHIHDLRHVCATHFIKNGGSLSHTKLMLGHQSERITERVYISILGDSAAEIAEKNKFQQVVLIGDST